MPETDDLRPSYYLGPDHPQETIKVIAANGWLEGFCKGSALKYITRGGNKSGEDELKDLKKAKTYLDFWIDELERIAELAEVHDGDPLPATPEQLRLFENEAGQFHYIPSR